MAFEPWCQVEMSFYEELFSLLPRPLSKKQAENDFMVKTILEKNLGIKAPSISDLAKRWGWKRSTADDLCRKLKNTTDPVNVRQESVTSPVNVRQESVKTEQSKQDNKEFPVTSPVNVRQESVTSPVNVRYDVEIIKEEPEQKEPLDKIKNIDKEEEVIKNIAQALPLISDEPDEAAGAFVQKNKPKNPAKNQAEYAASLDTHPEYIEKAWMIPILLEMCCWYWREESPTHQNPPMKMMMVWEQWIRHRWMDGALGITDLIYWLFGDGGKWLRKEGHTVRDCVWGIDRIEERITSAQNAHNDTAMSLEDLHERRKERYRRYMDENGIDYSGQANQEREHVEHS